MHSFVDRDMMMRYYYGLGVGHAYAHVQNSTNTAVDLEPIEAQEDEVEGELFEGSNGILPDAAHDSDSEYDSDFSILDSDEGETTDDFDSEDDSDDEEFYETEMMYNPH
jgi:hypothetical protein